MNLEIGKTYTYSYECCKKNNLDYKRYYYKITGLSERSFRYDHFDMHSGVFNKDLELSTELVHVSSVFQLCVPPQHIITKRSAIA